MRRDEKQRETQRIAPIDQFREQDQAAQKRFLRFLTVRKRLMFGEVAHDVDTIPVLLPLNLLPLPSLFWLGKILFVLSHELAVDLQQAIDLPSTFHPLPSHLSHNQ